MRASIIVPVIGYLIILNSALAQYLKLYRIEWTDHPTGAQWWDRN